MYIEWAIVTHVHNETDLLPQFVRHYAEEVNKIIVLDNESTDGCCDLVRDNAKVEIVNFPTGGWFDFRRLQAEALRRVRNTWKDGIQYVSFLGVDEFLVSKDGDVLGEVLASEWPNPVIFSEGHLMVVSPNEEVYNPAIPLVKQRKHGIHTPKYDKPAVWRPEIGINFHTGMHRIRGFNYPCTYRPLLLLHYKGYDARMSTERRWTQVRRWRVRQSRRWWIGLTDKDAMVRYTQKRIEEAQQDLAFRKVI